MKLTAEQRIERAHVQLMKDKDFCLFSGVFMIGDVKVSDVVPTAYTNGRDVTYGRSFVEGLDDKELNFVVLHEAMHKAYRHLFVWKKLAQENMMVANMAMDYVINLQLMDYDKPEVLAFPRDKQGNRIGLLDDQYRGMDTQQVFNILKKEMGDEQGKGGQPRGNPSGEGEDPSGGQKDKKSECLDDHGWDEAKEMDEEDKRKLSDEIDQALREGSILAGKMNGTMSREIKDLLTPKVDWREALRNFIKTTMKGRDKSTWRRPNRRFLAQGIIMPSTYSDKVGNITIGIDTSGSIGGEALSQFLGEVKSICDEVVPQGIDLLYWDSHVAKHEKYVGSEIDSLVNSTKPAGGGGTSPECVPKYMKKERIEAQCTVMLTDGYFYGDGCGDWSGVDSPVLWCVMGKKDFVPTVGKSVHIS
jgi:predicted metal-dependent peptidase